MKAAMVIDKKVSVADIPEPVPAANELLVRSLVCGICGSDLHCAHFAQEMADTAQRAVGMALLDPQQPISLGHEFCAEVLEPVKGDPSFKTGDRIVALPFLLRDSGLAFVGTGPAHVPGGFAERLTVDNRLSFVVPNGLSNELAALTEPMAVALHAVNQANVSVRDVPLVIGCGPIGLAIIAVLKMRGLQPIVAADFSAARREQARQLGADLVVDPREQSPYQTWEEAARTDDSTLFGAISPLLGGAGRRPSVIFECVGVPGMIQEVMTGAPYGARIMVVGLCMEPDRIEPASPILKELNVGFASFYSPQEFAQTLRHLAEGELDVGAMITANLPLAQIGEAFEQLAKPQDQIKILIRPGA
ncbi:zinc-binding dehydrogenase [Pseudomonas sp. UL073]|uniref:Zinc-binding dehydrogenase n=1 Tax=Zestomonas insulae TaxID=2809017 RepID=A0ABS2IFH0_9GAMM|nr:zinc-binding dehydrogenase [Pseudomonas insulae]MBM7061842.1 zinc-binding dehydrogenase [Pseudomonas insulae]